MFSEIDSHAAAGQHGPSNRFDCAAIWVFSFVRMPWSFVKDDEE